MLNYLGNKGAFLYAMLIPKVQKQIVYSQKVYMNKGKQALTEYWGYLDEWSTGFLELFLKCYISQSFLN